MKGEQQSSSEASRRENAMEEMTFTIESPSIRFLTMETPLESERPFVLINVAATADGKLAPSSREFVPFGGRRDEQHMFELRASADAVMSGARTIDLSDVDLAPGPAKYRALRLKNGLAEYNLRIIVSGSGSVDPKATIFQKRFSPILILTSGKAPAEKIEALRPLADEIKICGTERIDFAKALWWLRQKWNVKRLLCEGGGELNAAMLEAGLVDEIHLTLCPIIFGGRSAPTLADGEGIERLAHASHFKLISSRRVGDNMFLVYRADPRE